MRTLIALTLAAILLGACTRSIEVESTPSVAAAQASAVDDVISTTLDLVNENQMLLSGNSYATVLVSDEDPARVAVTLSPNHRAPFFESIDSTLPFRFDRLLTWQDCAWVTGHTDSGQVILERWTMAGSFEPDSSWDLQREQLGSFEDDFRLSFLIPTQTVPELRLFGWSEDRGAFLHLHVRADGDSSRLELLCETAFEDLLVSERDPDCSPRSSPPAAGPLTWSIKTLASGPIGMTEMLLMRSPGLGMEWCGNCSTNDLLYFEDSTGDGCFDRVFGTQADGLRLLQLLPFSDSASMLALPGWCRL